MKTQMMPVGNLKPYENNAKTHPAAQIKKLAEIIKEVGFLQPITVDKELVIISGHGRLLSAIEAGLTQVPVIVADDLTPGQVKAYRIADNKIAETDWDEEKLNEEIRDIEKEFPEMLEFLAIEEKELEERLKDEEKKQVSFDAGEKTSWELIVTLTSDDDQQALFIELRDRGFKVKA